MGVKLIFKDADFSANGIAPDYASISVDTDWTGWLCNFDSNKAAQQNSAWSTAFFEIPAGTTKIYLSGGVGSSYGVSLVSSYNTTNHTFTDATDNLRTLNPAGYLTRNELDLSSYPNAKYVMWCRVDSTGVPTVEVME